MAARTIPVVLSGLPPSPSANTPTAASSDQTRSAGRRAVTSEMAKGPRNSTVVAAPSGIRLTAS